MSFLLYFVGCIVFIAGLAWIATAIGVSQTYVLTGSALLLAVGTIFAIIRSRVNNSAV